MSTHEEKMRANELLDEAASYLGMISEIRSKAVLWKSRLEDAEAAGFGFNEVEEEANAAIAIMADDLAKYSQKLNDIRRELTQYGIFSQIVL